MDRRTFLQLAAGGLAAGALGGCASHGERGDAALTISAAEFHASRRFAATSFGNVAYIERGSGDAALFVHGFPLNGFQWRGAVMRLSPYRRCIAADSLALGYTEPADGVNITPQIQALMLAELLDRLGVGSVDLIANDSGGAVAQLFLMRYPQRVRTLLLTNCDTENDSPPPLVVPVIQAGRAGTFADDQIGRQLADKNLARSKDGIGGLCYTYAGDPSDEVIDCYFTPLVSTPRRKALLNAYAANFDPSPLVGVEAVLRRCTAPARIVWGTGDVIFAQASADYLDRSFGNSRGVRRVPGAKLFYPEEFPDLIAEEARNLWGV